MEAVETLGKFEVKVVCRTNLKSQFSVRDSFSFYFLVKRPPFCRVHTVIWAHLVFSISTIKASTSSNTHESPNLNHIRHHLNMSIWPGKSWRLEIWPFLRVRKLWERSRMKDYLCVLGCCLTFMLENINW